MRKINYLLMIVAVFSLLFISGCTEENEQLADVQMQPSSVEFCNNTNIITEDEKGNHIDGQMWYSQDNKRWELGLPKKFQKYITYSLWIDSPNYYVEPVMFVPDCINENDTKIQYIKFSAYKKAENKTLDFRLVNIRTYEFDNIYFVYADKLKYVSEIEIEYERYGDGIFLPYGGVMIFEVPKEISDISCAGARVSEPRTYSMNNQDNMADAFEISKDFEYTEIIHHNAAIACQLEFYNPDNIPKIDGKDFKITIIPQDWYMKKNKELIMAVTKESDDIYEFVSNQTVEINGIIGVEK